MAKRFEENMGDAALEAATGHGHDEWHDILDAAGARDWPHADTARWLTDERGVPAWWAQGITVGYEQARKGRLPGQQSDGTFATQKAKTIPGTRLQALSAVGAALSARFGDPSAQNLTASMPVMRWRLPDGTRIAASAGAENNSGTPITVVHEKLPDHAAVESAKRLITELLDEVARG